MLTEETLIVVAALVAIGLAVLGTLELLWPGKPRHPARSAAPKPRRWRSSHARHAAGGRDRYLKRPTSPEPAPPDGAVEPSRESTPKTASVVEAARTALEAETDISGEIGQLTAQAIRAIHEGREVEALAALERAERLLESVHREGLPLKRREEVERRLWWSYNKLGLRRLEAGAFEEAIEPLLRALRLAGTASDRRADTRAALIQAFEGWTDACALSMREVADGADQEAAIVWFNKLWTRLCAALEDGLSEGDLGTPLARARRLFEEIGGERV